jgi:3-oxoacyl-[acyl-carrier-protein] synthase II
MSRRPDGTHRVAITGIGMVTPGGDTAQEALDTVKRARSVAKPVPALREAGVGVDFACISSLRGEDWFSVRELRQLDRTMQLAVVAARQAVGQAGVDAVPDPGRAGVFVGTGCGGLSALEHALLDSAVRGIPAAVHAVPRVMANGSAAHIALRLGCRGPSLTYATACASGATALGEAMIKIRHGEVDLAVAGGVDTPVSPWVMTGFARMSALSTRTADPAAASRPFDDGRDGFVMGEGAAFLVLERWDHAQARGTAVLGELAGYGSTCDAFHIVAPDPQNEAAVACMERALADAGISVRDIGHINAHGTSTRLNDRAEATALARVFGDRGVPVTAPKGVLGHMFGAAGAAEAALALYAAAAGEVPPIANLSASDESKWVDLVSDAARRIPPGAPALSNSFGFGGHNACLIVRPPDA